MMKSILTIAIFLSLVVSGAAQTRNVVAGTNGAVVSPTNFWSADVSNARTGLGLGTAATNAASAFQPSSSVLTNLASSNGSALTNLTAANITGTVGLASNVTGTIAISNGGSGTTTAGGARTNLGLGTTNSVVFGEVATAGFKAFANLTEFYGPIWFGDTGGTNDIFQFEAEDRAIARTNLGIPLAALTSTNTTNFRTAIGLGVTNSVTFSNVTATGNIFIGSSAPYLRSDSGSGFVGFYDGIDEEYVLSIPNDTDDVIINTQWNNTGVRSNLGLGWSALTNSNAGTGLVSVNTNGQVVSPTNFWQAAPINTVVQYSQPVVSSTNAATNARNLYLYSLAISTVGVTNTVTLPTNAATFFGDVATVIHEGPTNSSTAIRQIGSATNIISINQFQEAVQFIYNGDGWKLADNISYTEPIYFSGTNAALYAAASRTNLGLGKLNSPSFQTLTLGEVAGDPIYFSGYRIESGSAGLLFDFESRQMVVDSVLLFTYSSSDISFSVPISFGTNTASATTRTNLGLPLAALTNTNNANFQAAIFTTNSTPTNGANVNAVNFNTAIHWMEVNVVTNGVTNNFRIPLFK